MEIQRDFVPAHRRGKVLALHKHADFEGNMYIFHNQTNRDTTHRLDPYFGFPIRTCQTVPPVSAWESPQEDRK